MSLSPWPARLVVALAAVLAWLPTWGAPYAEDDFLFLEAVSRDGAPGPLHYLANEGVMDHHFRPLADPLVFDLLYGLAGDAPWAYHALLMLTHVVAAWLVHRLARELSISRRGALLAAVIYVSRDLAFPSHVWGSGFSDLGSAAFALGALVALARWGRGARLPLFGLGLLLVLLAQLTKETAVVTAGLAVIVWRLQGLAWGRIARGAIPLALPVAALALWQMQLARFEGTGGERLYELTLGPHVLTLWPVFLVWCVAGVRELLDATAVRVVAIAAAYVGALALAARTTRGGGAAARTGWLVLGWLVVASVPALLAPNRVHTNYLALAAVGPILGLAQGLGAWMDRRRLPALAVAGGVFVAGVLLVQAKASARIASGGWVDVPKAERLQDAVREIREALPEPATDARLLVFGGLLVDVRVLGDPRGQGFGPQQVLGSALRVAYRRWDLEVLSLPPPHASPPSAYAAVHDILRSPGTTYVLDVTDGVRDLSESAREAVREGVSPAGLRRRLAGE